jgi:hypothetical protein
MKLYEIKEEFLRLADMDLDEQTMQDTLESLEFELEDKADNIACLIKSLEAESDAINAEADKLITRAKTKQVKADRLKEYLFNTFKVLGKDRIETARNVLQVKKNPPSVVLDDGFYHEDYVEYIETAKIDKNKLKEALKAGQAIDGARLETKERLVIK